MNTFLVAFLLGLSPTSGGSEYIQNQWNSLDFQEQAVIVRHFEEEYSTQLSSLNKKSLDQLKREIALRSVDQGVY